jgi:WG containing repeat
LAADLHGGRRWYGGSDVAYINYPDMQDSLIFNFNNLYMKKLLILSCILTFIEPIMAQNTLLIPYRDGNRWGYSDTLGNIIIKPRFDSVGFYKYGKSNTLPDVAMVVQKGKKGLITTTGNFILPIQFDSINLDVLLEGHFVVKKNNKFGLHDAVGKPILPVRYEQIEYKIMHRVTDQSTLGGIFATKNGKLYHIEKNGQAKELNESEWTDLEIKLEEITTDWFGTDEHSHEIYQGENLTKNYPAFDLVKTMLSDGQHKADFLQAKKDGFYGLINYKGEVITPISYDSIIYQSEWRFLVQQNRKWGVININNKLLLPIEYDQLKRVEDFFSTYLVTSKGNLKGFFIPSTFYPPIPAVYQDIAYFDSFPVNSNWSFTILKVVKDGRAGFVGENGVEFFKN